MSNTSKIEWTDASTNPIRARNKVTGKVGWHCEHASAGCVFCYAEAFNMRLGTGLPFKPGHRKDIEIYLDEQMLVAPLRWRKPRMIFVCSMTDLFASFVLDEWIIKQFAMMALAEQHTLQVVTKRDERMRAFVNDPATPDKVEQAMDEIAPEHWCKRELQDVGGWPLKNVWKLVSVENQENADRRVPNLLATQAAVRGVSAEPLLGPIDFTRLVVSDGIQRDALQGWRAERYAPGHYEHAPHSPDTHLDWVIVGGESGSDARPMHVTWARSIRDQCAAADVAFFFKQHGAWVPVCDMNPALDPYHPAPETDPEAIRRPKHNLIVMHNDGKVFAGRDSYAMGAFLQGTDAMTMFRVGKKAAGRLLDGREWNEMPRVGAAREEAA